MVDQGSDGMAQSGEIQNDRAEQEFREPVRELGKVRSRPGNDPRNTQNEAAETEATSGDQRSG